MRKKTVRILTGTGILVVALAMIYAIAVGVSALKLRRAYAALEKDGRPMKASDIIPAQVPDTENAALLYESAFLLLKAQPVGEKDLLGHLGKLAMAYANGSADPNHLPELQQLMQLETVASAIRAVQQGAMRSACRFERDYEGEVGISPYLNDLRSFTSILAAQAILDAEAGRTDQAWDVAVTQLKFADALRTEPAFIVSQLVRVAQIKMACMTIQRLCDHSVPNDEQARETQSLLGKLDDMAPLVLAVDGERLLFGEWLFSLGRADMRESLFRIVGESYVPEIVQKLRVRWITFKPFLLTDHALYLNLMRNYAKQFSGAYERSEADALDGSFSDIRQRHTLTAIITPAMARVKEIYLRMVAEMHVTQTGLALLQYRKTHQAFPDVLDALALQYSQDPFSQGLLLYRPEGEGFILYSVGPDQKDNSGRPRQRKGNAEYDLVWRFPSQPDR